MNKRRGMFITLEGGEGAGKSTLQAKLNEVLSARGLEIVTTREPGGTPLGEAVRELALHPPGGTSLSPLAEALLMNAARKDHLDRVIRPALARSAWVICDRFSDSTRAYQSVDGGVPMRVLISMEASVLAQTRPDLTLLLDAPPGQLRVRRGTDSDAFEARGMDFHRVVREAFLGIAETEPDRVKVINALDDAATVLETALAAIDQRAARAAAA